MAGTTVAQVTADPSAQQTPGGQQQLLGGSMRDAMVSLWTVDVNAMKPFNTNTHADAGLTGARSEPSLVSVAAIPATPDRE